MPNLQKMSNSASRTVSSDVLNMGTASNHLLKPFCNNNKYSGPLTDIARVTDHVLLTCRAT